MKKIWTSMLNRYLVKFAFRLLVFITVFIYYLKDEEWLYETMTMPVYRGITPLNVLWFAFMGIMFLHIFPGKQLTMALRKADTREYVPVQNYSEAELLKFIQDQNVKAWKVMLCWLSFNAVFGILYLFKVIERADLLMLTVFYFLCDYICILFFCPFQTLLMKNRCCVNCRIYDWGHFMMFTPMLFIQDFFSWSLFFMSLIVLIHWEIIYAKHPKQFWFGSNQNLRCINCKDKTCQLKHSGIPKKV